MGAEAGEHRQFTITGQEVLDLDDYATEASRQRMLAWYRALCRLRRNNTRIQGPAPLSVHRAEEQHLAFSRGDGADYFVILNFGWQPLNRSLWEFGLPEATYRESLNSSWPEYQVEGETLQTNGGNEAWLHRGSPFTAPAYGATILERR